MIWYLTQNVAMQLSPQLAAKSIEFVFLPTYTSLAKDKFTFGGVVMIFFSKISFELYHQLDAPRLIGEPLVNATTKEKVAELVCRVKANPPTKPSSVYWRRVTDEPPTAEINASIITGGSDSSSVDQKRNEKPSISGLRCNQVSQVYLIPNASK